MTIKITIATIDITARENQFPCFLILPTVFIHCCKFCRNDNINGVRQGVMCDSHNYPKQKQEMMDVEYSTLECKKESRTLYIMTGPLITAGTPSLIFLITKYLSSRHLTDPHRSS